MCRDVLSCLFEISFQKLIARQFNKDFSIILDNILEIRIFALLLLGNHLDYVELL